MKLVRTVPVKRIAFIFMLASQIVVADGLKGFQACKNTPTTAEADACIYAEVENAEKQMERYLKTAIQKVNSSNLAMQQLIMESQQQWLIYRDKHCDAIYEYWKNGTVRNAMHGVCLLTMTEQRTYKLWNNYLTYVDSTPPLLPKPARSYTK